MKDNRLSKLQTTILALILGLSWQTAFAKKYLVEFHDTAAMQAFQGSLLFSDAEANGILQ